MSKKDDKLIKKICDEYKKSKISASIDFCKKEKLIKNKKGEIVQESSTHIIVKPSNKISDFSIKENSKIFFEGFRVNKALNKGILYSIKENKLKFEISEKKEEEMIIIDGGNKIVKLGKDTIDFSMNYLKSSEKIFLNILKKGPDVIIIGINEKYVKIAEKMRDLFNNTDTKIIILNYELSSFRSRLALLKKNMDYAIGIFWVLGKKERCC